MIMKKYVTIVFLLLLFQMTPVILLVFCETNNEQKIGCLVATAVILLWWKFGSVGRYFFHNLVEATRFVRDCLVRVCRN